MTDHAPRVPEPAVTPPDEEPGRPGVVTAAVALWIVLGVLMVGTALLFALALAFGGVGPGTAPLAVVAAMVLLAAGGVGTVIAARRLGRGSRRARTALTAVGGVLAAVGLVQVTFLGAGGAWFVAFLVGAVLLHLPAARAWFGRSR